MKFALPFLLAAAVGLTACTPAQDATALKDEQMVLAGTTAVCAMAEPAAVAFDAGAPVTFVCTSAEALEEASVVVTQAVVKVQASKAKAFAAAHAAPAPDAGK
jgi:hypothetical protein